MGNNKNIAFVVILFLLMMALYNIFNGGQSTPNATQVSFSEFLDSVDAGQVDAVTLDGEKIYIRSGSNNFTTVQPRDAEILPILRDAGVAIEASAQEQSGLMSMLGVWRNRS